MLENQTVENNIDGFGLKLSTDIIMQFLVA